MTTLTHELMKNCTTLVRLPHLNDLCSNLCFKNSDVYALRADFGYPEHLIPHNNKKILAYMGIYKKKVEMSYGQAHFITFFHEPKIPNKDVPIGILEHMYNIYMEEQVEDLKESGYRENQHFSVELFPLEIKETNVGYWRWVFDDDWGVTDKISLDDLIDDYHLTPYVNWKMLRDILPENIDDYNGSVVESDEESEFDDGEETEEDEIEEGEIVSDSEA